MTEYTKKYYSEKLKEYREKYFNEKHYVDWSLVAYMVRDWPIVKEYELDDLAWAMTKENYVTKNDVEYLFECLEDNLNRDVKE